MLPVESQIFFRERQGYRDAGEVIKLVKGARWIIKQC